MENEFTLKDTIVLVTGGSRGIGRGIAIALGKFGATVYITGRPQNAPNKLSGSIEETAKAVTNAGGIGHAIYCDHAIDDDVAAVFERIEQEVGHIDILVNNVTSLASDILSPPPFWTKSIQLADQITVGLRSAYISSFYAAPLLLKSKKALIANISYYGAVSYHLDPAYGATKAGLDKMTWDMAIDFKPYGVSVISIWPGPTATEFAVSLLSQIEGGEKIMKNFETPEFTGLVIKHVYLDPDVLAKSGSVLIGAEAAIKYGFKDINGKLPQVLKLGLGSPVVYFEVNH
ncbi:SDR family NAD(P)-dependent oxidoreductase [Pedobacter jejuensis]|uniref:SDR family NAD(P)-dependent oxidoreductase n=1 Tax=Pedobacter jejuensis TaxID=1268550 RepID=A0A3N0BW62_9SPHI|nr:SDR family NAD(P)-dependent oxidoreductase [Pedobacter jejuensis]RNL53947.1 SDR family NAD(P)-dependent oxidoreductase [Pedobacter jejuensis]